MIRKLRDVEVGFLISRDILETLRNLTKAQHDLALDLLYSSYFTVESALTVKEIAKIFKLPFNRVLRNNLNALVAVGFLKTASKANGEAKPFKTYYVCPYIALKVKDPGAVTFVDKIKHEREKTEIQQFKENTCGTWSVDKPGSYKNKNGLLGEWNEKKEKNGKI